MNIYLGIYLIITIVAFLVVWDDCTHDSPFRNRWQAAKTGAWVGILWGPLVLLSAVYWMFSYIQERIRT